MVETTHPAVHACANCGRTLDGPFCAECGQAERLSQPPTVSHFFHDLVHEFLHVDGSIFRTLKALFFQPGKLTEEYWAGHVVAWIRPIRLFLVVVAFHLLLSTGVGPQNFFVHLDRDSKGQLNFGVFNSRSQLAGRPGTPVSPEEQLKFSEKFEKAYHLIRYSPVLLFALGSWLLYRRQQPYFINHLIAGVHFYAFWYFLAIVLSLPSRIEPTLDILNYLNLLSVVYLFFTFRRLFPESWLLRSAKTLALFSVLFITEMALGGIAAVWVMLHMKT